MDNMINAIDGIEHR